MNTTAPPACSATVPAGASRPSARRNMPNATWKPLQVPAWRRQRRLSALGGCLAAALIFTGCGGEAPSVQVNPNTAPSQGIRDGFAAPAPPAYNAPTNGYGGYYQPQG